MENNRAKYSVSTFHYGSCDSQVADLYLPTSPKPTVVCLIHGGFWRMPYGREELEPIARDLASRGFAVWNLEYRRLGESGGGWPGTVEDVVSGINYLGNLATRGIALNLARVTVVGHSAGGHLAFLSAVSEHMVGKPFTPLQIRPIAIVGLAPIVDLENTSKASPGDRAVREFLGRSTSSLALDFAKASPIAMLPLGVRQLIIHGSTDDVVPVEVSRTYVNQAAAAGDKVEIVELSAEGHMDHLDPKSAAHAALLGWLSHLSTQN